MGSVYEIIVFKAFMFAEIHPYNQKEPDNQNQNADRGKKLEDHIGAERNTPDGQNYESTACDNEADER